MRQRHGRMKAEWRESTHTETVLEGLKGASGCYGRWSKLNQANGHSGARER